jgi:2-keto-3-deoxy-L-rhamnonate aldolase RhmA
MPRLREKLRSGPKIGLSVMYPAPGMIERIGPDWDWIWIDAQHGELDYQDVLALVRAAETAGSTAVVRVPWNEFAWISRALDTHCDAVVVPCVENVAEARQAVAAAKFPPLGRRSYGSRRIIDRIGRTYSDTANTDVMLIVQIESPEALENAEAIAAVPGIDGLFLGPDDVTLRRGHSMTAPRNPAMLEADMTSMANACHKHGKVAVTVAIGPDMIRLVKRLGYKMIATAGDVSLLANTSKSVTAEARAVLSEGSPEPTKPAPQPARTLY